MKLAFFAPLLILLSAPWVLQSMANDRGLPWSQSPSAAETATESIAGSAERARGARLDTARTRLPEPAAAETVSQAAPESSADTAPAAVSEPAPAAAETIPLPEPQTQTHPPERIAAIEQEIYRLTNLERTNRALPELGSSSLLSHISRLHATDMGTNAFFDHQNLEDCSSSCRADSAGYRWRSVGENIYMMSGFDLEPTGVAERVVMGWMNSSGHRANILGESFTEAGVGAWSDGESVYVTAMYAKPR